MYRQRLTSNLEEEKINKKKHTKKTKQEAAMNFPLSSANFYPGPLPS